MLPNIMLPQYIHDRYKIIFKYVVSKQFWSANINQLRTTSLKGVDKRFIFTD